MLQYIGYYGKQVKNHSIITLTFHTTVLSKCTVMACCSEITDIKYKSENFYKRACCISSASVDMPLFLRQVISVLQLTGFSPASPRTHFFSISMLIWTGSLRCLCTIPSTMAPVRSLRSRIPNVLYLVPISCGMLIVLPWLAGKDNSSTRVGVESVTKQGIAIMNNSQECTLNCMLTKINTVVGFIKTGCRRDT